MACNIKKDQSLSIFQNDTIHIQYNPMIFLKKTLSKAWQLNPCFYFSIIAAWLSPDWDGSSNFCSDCSDQDNDENKTRKWNSTSQWRYTDYLSLWTGSYVLITNYSCLSLIQCPVCIYCYKLEISWY